MSDDKLVQRIHLYVDMYTTDSEEYDCPYTVQQTYAPDYKPYQQAEGTTRYKVTVDLPKIVKEYPSPLGPVKVVEVE